jgi:pimeloyl-ACP methyl ester carboxylesterase
MIAVSTSLPEHDRGRPPIVLVHGAANSSAVWTYWAPLLVADGWPVHAIDLRGHGANSTTSLVRTSMHDYLADVRQLLGQLRRRPVIIGWSMGGLVALMAAAEGLAHACIGLAPSTPARAIDATVPLREGEFGPEEYGITCRNPDHQPAMPDLDRDERIVALGSLGRESRYARDERQRGIVVETLPCPLSIVTGSEDRQWPRQRYDGLHLPADYLIVDGASHWGLVLNRRALAKIEPAVLDWLGQQTIGGRR